MKLVLFAAASIFVAPAAWAQGSPSVDDLIRDLKPHADRTTRGIHLVAPTLGTPTLGTPVLGAPAVREAEVRPSAPRLPARYRPSAPASPTGPAELASTSMQIQFETGSDRLTPAATRELDKLGRALSNAELTSYRFRIEGHTDAVGARDTNQVLSERRATAVVEYIAMHYGVDRSRLTPVGMGFAQMAVPTAEGVAEPRNRRVQIVNIGA